MYHVIRQFQPAGSRSVSPLEPVNKLHSPGCRFPRGSNAGDFLSKVRVMGDAHYPPSLQDLSRVELPPPLKFRQRPLALHAVPFLLVPHLSAYIFF